MEGNESSPIEGAEFSSVSETQDLTEGFQIFRLDTATILTQIDHHLKGETFDLTSQQWKKTGSALLNDVGRRALLTHLTFVINPNTILSKFEPEQIDLLCYDYDSTLDRLLILHQEDWEMGGLEDVRILKKDLMIFVEATLRRAERGFESKSIGKIMKTLETIREKPEKRKLPWVSGRRTET